MATLAHKPVKSIDEYYNDAILTRLKNTFGFTAARIGALREKFCAGWRWSAHTLGMVLLVADEESKGKKIQNFAEFAYGCAKGKTGALAKSDKYIDIAASWVKDADIAAREALEHFERQAAKDRGEPVPPVSEWIHDDCLSSTANTPEPIPSHFKQDIQDNQYQTGQTATCTESSTTTPQRALKESEPQPEPPEVHDHMWAWTKATMPEFVEWAIERNEIELAQRTHTDVFLTPMFIFVREIKGHPSMQNLTATKAFSTVHKIIHNLQLNGKFGWEAHFDVLSEDDAEAMFLDHWNKIRYTPSQTPLQQAAKKAADSPLTPLKRADCAGYCRFLSIAGWLQVTMGDRAIMLPCEEMAKYLDVSPRAVTTYRQWAEKDGHIRTVKKHNHLAGRATEFRFDTTRFKALDEVAQKVAG